MPEMPLCCDCEGKISDCAIGTCSSCSKGTPSMSYKYCIKCAIRENACMSCGKSLLKNK